MKIGTLQISELLNLGRRFALLVLLIVPTVNGYSQVDSTKKELKFDLGLTRDRDINLWPIFKRTISEIESDKQLLFPIFRNYQNFRLGEKRSHLLPFYWTDSSRNEKNLRILSTFYPSIVHTSKNFRENTTTFTFVELAPRINILEFKKSPDGLIMQNNLLFFLWFKNNQLTQKSHLVVFPIYWDFSSPKRESKTLFPIYSYGSYANKTRKYLAITPLFWNLESQKRTTNILLPVWWNRAIKTNYDTIRNNTLFPIYYSHSDRFTNNRVLFPVVWSLRNSRYASLTIAPLVSFGHGIKTNQSHLMLTPIFWHFKNDESIRTILFPILWKYNWHTRYENYKSFILFPVYWNITDNSEKSITILPFIWSKITPYYHSFTFVPLFSRGLSTDGLTGHLAVTPIFWHIKSSTGYSNIFFPVWYYQKKTLGDNVGINNVLFPIYWGWKREAYRGNILLPVLWQFKNQNYQSFSIVPFVSFGKSSDGTKSYSAITPLYWRFKTTEGKGQLLFPLWFEKEKTLEGEIKSSSQVVLLYWKYKDSQRKHQGVFPMVWRFKKQDRSSFTIFPIVSAGQRDSSKRKYLTVSPLFWRFKNQHRTFNTLFPIWWSQSDYSSKNTKHFKLLIPTYYSQWDSIRTRRIVFPILWQFKNPQYNSFSLVPLFSFGKSTDRSVSHLTITPLFWNFKNEQGSTTTLLPFFWKSKYGNGSQTSETTILFPIYYDISNRDIKEKVIFPIVWSLNNKKYKSLTVAPLFSFGRSADNTRRHYALTPFYYNIKNQNCSSRILFPVWWNIKRTGKNGYSYTNILFPVYWSFQNQHRTAKVLFPIVWNFTSAKARSFTFIPVYSKGTSTDGLNHLMVTPLFWQFKNHKMSRTIMFPTFTAYTDKSGNKKYDILFFLFRNSRMNGDTCISIIWPIVERSKSVDYKYFRIAPLVWSKKSSTFSYFTIQPFFYRNKSKEQTTSRVLWELYVHRNRFDIKKSNSVLWKFITWDKYTNGDKEFRIIHLLFANSNVNGKVEKSLFPIYYISKDRDGNKSLSVMLYFYNSVQRKIPNTSEFYQEERIFWLIRIRSNYRTLKNKGIEID
ncbi:hypothetical protein CYCD_11130 [Tenuifilaceae bacterium CYCD]|nr:hypothetical protein CYCD_11130 [Tenuifilaceae bacterium CYCD]